jgi:hypothetical protein
MCLNETYSKVRICKYLSDTFDIQNGLKQGDALSPLLFNFASEYDIRNVRKSQVALTLNWTNLLLVYADVMNLFGDNINPMKKNTDSLTDASKEVGIEINEKKSNFIFQSRYHNAWQNHNMKTANISLENVAQLNILERHQQIKI